MHHKFFKSFVLVSACLSLNACAGGARPDMMAVTPPADYTISKSNKFYDAIAIADVAGGKETNPMLMSKVDNTAFQGALEQSLDAHGLLDTNGNATYILDTELLALEQPMIGFSFTVDSVVDYKLMKASNNSVVFEETIKGSGKATMGDSALGVERLRIANEYSIKNNIHKFINDALGAGSSAPAVTMAPGKTEEPEPAPAPDA